MRWRSLQIFTWRVPTVIPHVNHCTFLWVVCVTFEWVTQEFCFLSATVAAAQEPWEKMKRGGCSFKDHFYILDFKWETVLIFPRRTGAAKQPVQYHTVTWGWDFCTFALWNPNEAVKLLLMLKNKDLLEKRCTRAVLWNTNTMTDR